MDRLLPCVHPVPVDLCGAPGLPVDVVDVGAVLVGAGDAVVVRAGEGEDALTDGVVRTHSYAIPLCSSEGGCQMGKI